MATKKKVYPTRPTSEVPAVLDYETAKKVLGYFLEEHSDVFHAYNLLREELNQKLEKAEGTVRSLSVNCGDFKIHSTSNKYDVQRLLSLIEKEAFLDLGGTSQTQVTWGMDKAKLEIAIETGKIPKDIAEAITTTTIRYTTPKPR